MNHNRPRRGLVRVNLILSGAVFEVESFGELEVKLDGSALEGTVESIADFDVDLRTVEGTVSGIQLPLAWVVGVEGLCQLLCNRGKSGHE